MGVDISCGLSLTEWSAAAAAAALCARLGKVNLNGVDCHPATNCSL